MKISETWSIEVKDGEPVVVFYDHDPIKIVLLEDVVAGYVEYSTPKPTQKVQKGSDV